MGRCRRSGASPERRISTRERSRPRDEPASLDRAWSVVCLVAPLACGCGDDDGGVVVSPRVDSGTDAGRASLGPVDSGEFTRDASQAEDAAVGDASIDAGMLCETASPSAYGAVREDWWPSTVVPLEVLFAPERAPTLDDFEGLYDCNAEIDGGTGGELWRRAEGCGTVVFENVMESWPRLFVFDSVTGELVAGARLDDVVTPLGDHPCMDAAYVAGSVRPSCPADVVQHCL
jgi:hypothetical protein